MNKLKKLLHELKEELEVLYPIDIFKRKILRKTDFNKIKLIRISYYKQRLYLLRSNISESIITSLELSVLGFKLYKEELKERLKVNWYFSRLKQKKRGKWKCYLD